MLFKATRTKGRYLNVGTFPCNLMALKHPERMKYVGTHATQSGTNIQVFELLKFAIRICTSLNRIVSSWYGSLFDTALKKMVKIKKKSVT